MSEILFSNIPAYTRYCLLITQPRLETAINRKIIILNLRNFPESTMLIHRIWIDASAKGRYEILEVGQPIKMIPAEFVRARYSQVKYYFSIYEGVKNKLYSSEPGVEQQKIQELQSEIDSHLIRLVKSLTHDLQFVMLLTIMICFYLDSI